MKIETCAGTISMHVPRAAPPGAHESRGTRHVWNNTRLTKQHTKDSHGNAAYTPIGPGNILCGRPAGRLVPDGTSTRARTALTWDVWVSKVGARQQAEAQRLPHHADAEAAAAEPVLPLESGLGG